MKIDEGLREYVKRFSLMQLSAYTKKSARVLRDYVAGAVGPLAARVKALEDKKLMFDEGVWERGRVYERGAHVSYQGTAWIAQTTTSAQPGHDHTWRMSVKNREARH